MSSSPTPRTSENPETLTLIDGSGYLFRAYHALPPLTDPEGTPVGAVYGFLNMLMKFAEASTTSHLAVIFDAGRKTFRNELYADYKANRPEAPEDLIPQFPLVREAAKALNLPAIEMEGFEADDLIATYAKLAVNAGMDVTIVSSDKDLMQLVGGAIRMLDPMKQKPIGEAEVIEKFGVKPEYVQDVLALMGDSSDNIPGVPGIGQKTAAQLIDEYGDLETLLTRAGEITQNKRRENLIAFADQARLSYRLVALKDNVDVPASLADFSVKAPDGQTLQAFCEKHGFRKLMTKVSEKYGATPRLQSEVKPSEASAGMSAKNIPSTANQKREYTLIQDSDVLKQWIDEALDKGAVAFDTETTGLDSMTAELVGFSLCYEEGHACYVPVGHKQATHNTDELFSEANTEISVSQSQVPLREALTILKPLLENPAVLKIGQNIKYDMHIMQRYGCAITPYEDTMQLSYLLGAGAHGHGMDTLAEHYLGITPIGFSAVTGTGKSRISFAEVELAKACEYAAEDADITLQLYRTLKPMVAENHMLTLYETIERPMVAITLAMETEGIAVNREELQRLSSEFGLRMKALEQEIHTLAGHPFNVSSPKQLGEVLFEEMGLAGGKKSSKTGAYSTDNTVLETLASEGHTLPEKVIEHRGLAKLKSTYTDALQQQINTSTGRVHTSYHLAGTTTGRFSSSDPNLQNIPIRTEEGKQIRYAFVAKEGCKLISADYSQIELRLLAHMADIVPLKEAFKQGDDIHAITASQMFGMKVSEVSGDLRRKAKTINFGIIYGISAHGLATRLGISRSEAAEYIEAYFTQYPGIKDYMESAKEYARAHGYVETLYGRRCHLPDINAKNGARRQFSERAAINAPLQGTAADIIKRAMITLVSSPASGRKFQLLLQVHDELIFEVEHGNEAEVLRIITPAMEHAASLSVPLLVEVGVGDNWGEIH